MFGAKVVAAVVANRHSALLLRARGVNRTAFHLVAPLFAVVVARKLLWARETTITEIAECGHRKEKERRRDRGEVGNSTELRRGLTNETARSGRRIQRLRAKTGRFEASWSRPRNRARRRAFVRKERRGLEDTKGLGEVGW